MESKVTEIARVVYRISTFNSDFGIQFNQFLIKDGPKKFRVSGFGFRASFAGTANHLQSPF